MAFKSKCKLICVTPKKHSILDQHIQIAIFFLFVLGAVELTAVDYSPQCRVSEIA